MGKFGDVYDKLVTELAIAAPLVVPAAKAVGAVGARAAITRGVTALAGGLAATMNAKNAVKPTTKTKTSTKVGSTELMPTKSKSLPAAGEPIIKSKFDEVYERIAGDLITELVGKAAMPSLGSSTGVGPSVTSTSTYTGPGALRPTSSYSYNVNPSTTAQAGRAAATSRLAPIVGTAAIPVAAAAGLAAAQNAWDAGDRTTPPPILGPIGVAAGPFGAKQIAQTWADQGVYNPPGQSSIDPKNFNTGQGRYNARGTTLAPTPTPTTPISTPSQPDQQAGTLLPTPGTDATTTDVQAQSQTSPQSQGIGKAIGIATGLGLGLASQTQPQYGRINPQPRQTDQKLRDISISTGLIPTSSKVLPPDDEPIVQDKFYIK
jgi:hypothetical protein